MKVGQRGAAAAGHYVKDKMDARGFIVPSRIVGALCLLPAIVTAGLAIWFYTSTAKFLRSAVSVPGVVTEVRPSSGSDGTTYHSVFEFSNTDGTKRQSMTSWSSNPPAHAVGDEVEVLYSSADPGDVRLRSFTGLWFGAVLCAALTVMPLVMAFVFIWLVPFTIRRVWPTSPAIAP